MTDINLGDLPELVRDSRLPAAFQADGRNHYTIHDRAGIYRGKQNQVWRDIENLGSGGQGSVDLQINDQSGRRQFRAVKSIRFSQSRLKDNPKLYVRELEAIFKFSQARYSPLFVRSSGWFTSQNHIYIAMEYCELGDLYRYLQDPTKCSNNRLPEDEVCEIASQILHALQCMHEENFAHRDIKPANILIEAHPPSPWQVKVADFGLSKRNGDAESTTVRGTPSFMPPELLGLHEEPRAADPYPVDMWCLGETLFRALSGRATFDNMAEIVKYYDGQKEFPRHLLEGLQLSEEAILFLHSLILPIPEKRLTARDALAHPWIEIDARPSSPFQIVSRQLSRARYANLFQDSLSKQQISIASASWTREPPQDDRSPPAEEINSQETNYKTDFMHNWRFQGTTEPSKSSDSGIWTTTESLRGSDIAIGERNSQPTEFKIAQTEPIIQDIQENRWKYSIPSTESSESHRGSLFGQGGFPRTELIYEQIIENPIDSLTSQHIDTPDAKKSLANTLYTQDRLANIKRVGYETTRFIGSEAPEQYEATKSIRTETPNTQKHKTQNSAQGLALKIHDPLTNTSMEQPITKQKWASTTSLPTSTTSKPSRMSKLGRNFRKIIKGRSGNAVEIAIKKAINSELSKLDANHLEEIAQMTYDERHCSEIMRFIIEALREEKKDLQYIAKILQILEYCLCRGSEMIEKAAFSNRHLIQGLGFRFFTDGRGHDSYYEVRAAARRVSELIEKRNEAALAPEPISL